MREFTAKELQSYLESAAEKPLLLDVREPWEFQTAHIDGATLVPMRNIAARVNDLDPQQEIVVICHHGVRSRMVGLFLENHGFSNVINLSGGVDAWARDVDERMATY
jgi:rhodanese-related sulfurtransferase